MRVGLQTGYMMLTYLIFLNKCELDNRLTPRRDHFICLSYNLDGLLSSGYCSLTMRRRTYGRQLGQLAFKSQERKGEPPFQLNSCIL